MMNSPDELATLANTIATSEGKPGISSAADPAVFEVLGEAIATQLETLGVRGIVHWPDDVTAMIALTAARRLNVGIYRAIEDLGIVTWAPLVPPADTLAAIAISWEAPDLSHLDRLVSSANASIAACVSVIRPVVGIWPTSEAVRVVLAELVASPEVTTDR